MKINIEQLNEDIKLFPQVAPITPEMHRKMDGVARLVMLDRYAFKDTEKRTLRVGDVVVATVKPDPQFPKRLVGTVDDIDDGYVVIKDEAGELVYDDENGHVLYIPLEYIDKPLELFYEQIAARNARGLASVESEEKRDEVFAEFYEVLSKMDFVPAGRVLYGAGTGTDVTYFNCFVMPYPHDSRGGIAQHRTEVMEIMSRGGGKHNASLVRNG